MTNNELARLNRVLADNLGRNLHSEPIYKWIWSRELTFPMRSGSKMIERNGLTIFTHSYSNEPQVTDDCWLVARWLAPCSYDEWLSSFGSEAGYPSKGLYYTTDVMLKPGLEPNDAITNDVVGKVKAYRSLTLSQILEAQKSKMDRSEASTDARVEDFISNAATAFGNVPGKRGGRVSFGGV